MIFTCLDGNIRFQGRKQISSNQFNFRVKDMDILNSCSQSQKYRSPCHTAAWANSQMTLGPSIHLSTTCTSFLMDNVLLDLQTKYRLFAENIQNLKTKMIRPTKARVTMKSKTRSAKGNLITLYWCVGDCGLLSVFAMVDFCSSTNCWELFIR